MPFAFQVFAVCFGVIYFLVHLAWAVYSVRFFTARDDRLEAAGKVIPGFAGLLVAAAALLLPSGWGVACTVVAFPLMFVGRAVYELIVFRNSGGGPAAH
jgi:hypothetical protein